MMTATISTTRAVSSDSKSRIKNWFAPKKKRWPAHVFINIVSVVVIAWVLIFQWLEANWHLGVDIQTVQCLPYEYFLVSQNKPEIVVKGKIYQYEAKGLAPVVKDGTPMAKIAAAVAGDEVVVSNAGVFVNGKLWGPINPTVLKKSHKSLSSISARYVVPAGKVLMLGTLPRSYDGRYWGMVDIAQVQGRAIALW